MTATTPSASSAYAPPILTAKDYGARSVFTAENLLREARRQKGLPEAPVPAVCVLDPDGDLVDSLRATGQARAQPAWSCYHTKLDTFTIDGQEIGIIGCAVGASFAVLVAEELFACGCRLLISITSAGQILSLGAPPYVVLIERALRDEGTSYHYLPPSPYSVMRADLAHMVTRGWDDGVATLHRGASWTTDAPFRETDSAIERARALGIVAVEMEAAALYALATARQWDIVCYAFVTNQMAQSEGDFEKGEANGSALALRVIGETARRWRATLEGQGRRTD